jgi:hypothetical protein
MHDAATRKRLAAFLQRYVDSDPGSQVARSR